MNDLIKFGELEDRPDGETVFADPSSAAHRLIIAHLRKAFEGDWFSISEIHPIMDVLDPEHNRETPEWKLLRLAHTVKHSEAGLETSIAVADALARVLFADPLDLADLVGDSRAGRLFVAADALRDGLPAHARLALSGGGEPDVRALKAAVAETHGLKQLPESALSRENSFTAHSAAVAIGVGYFKNQALVAEPL